METIGRNDACWCGSGKKYKKCHCQFDEKLKELQQEGHFIPSHGMIKTPEQIEKIKESGKINIAVLDYVAEHIKAGITTQQIDDWVYEQTTSRGAIPAPLNYEGFPKSVCTSVNDQVCHGIPSEDVVLQEGDIINVDVSTIYHGYFSDSSRMFSIGEGSEEKKKLVDVTKECIPVVPSQHYFMGGIDVDKYSKTSMDRLYAVGETACNGVHGKNRLASNSLLESLVFAKRAAKRMIETYSKTSDREVTIDKDLYKNYEDKYKDEILEEIERERKKHE